MTKEFNSKKYFTKARQEYIDKPLKEFGFKKYKSSTVARITKDNIFQFLNFQKSAYGGERFTVNVAIRPLYRPHEDYLILNPGNRLGQLISGKDIWWNYEDEVNGNKSFDEVKTTILKYALPFFDATANSVDIIKTYSKNIFGKSIFGNKVEWGSGGWLHFDFGHIYLKSNDLKNATKQFNLCHNSFAKDERDWAQTAAKQCLNILATIDKGKVAIDNYLTDCVNQSKMNLKLTDW